MAKPRGAYTLYSHLFFEETKKNNGLFEGIWVAPSNACDLFCPFDEQFLINRDIGECLFIERF